MIVGPDGHTRATGKVLKKAESYCLVECDRFNSAKTGETVLVVVEDDMVGTGTKVRVKLAAGRRLTLDLSAKLDSFQPERVETRFHGRGSIATAATSTGNVRLTVLGVTATGFQFKAEDRLPVNRELALTVLIKGQYQIIKGEVVQLNELGSRQYSGFMALNFSSRLDRRLWETALDCAGYEFS
jgi:hypothetical protein